MGITSTGSGNFPSTPTNLDSSAMQTNFSATAATIFSRVSAPPPPLIMARCSVISSAPSRYTGSSFTLFRSTTRMPRAFSRSAVFCELATAPSIRFFIFASSSMKRSAVEPVPTPTMAPSITYLIASFATVCFSSSWVIGVSKFLLRFLRCVQVGDAPQRHLGGEEGRFRERRMRMDGEADVLHVRAHLQCEHQLGDQLAGVHADNAGAEYALGRLVVEQLGH